jgi:hypothetical protein
MSLSLKTYRHSNDIPEFTDDNVFHSKDLFRIYEMTPGYTPYMFVAYEDNIGYLMHLLAVVQRDRYILSHSFVRRCIVTGNGVRHNNCENFPAVFQALLSHLIKELDWKAFLIEFRNLDEALFGYRIFRNAGFFPVSWLRVYNSLHDGISVEQRLTPSKLRQVRKGLRNGATFAIATDSQDVLSFARMLRHVYSSHIRQYFPDVKFFLNILRDGGNRGRLKSLSCVIRIR